MNYFELFGLPVSFFVDLALLKSEYHKLSFEFHPDFHAAGSSYTEDQILIKSAEINRAFQTLSNDDKRLAYVLELTDAMPEEGKAQIPQEFLMEMMDYNEQLMELQFDPSEEAKAEFLKNLNELEKSLYSEVEQDLQNFNFQDISTDSLKKIAEFYLKKKYLLRLKQNLINFAPQ